MTYLPPFAKLRAMLNIATRDGRLTVNASYDDFVRLIRAMLSMVEVDEAWYLEKYPDVVEGIKAGNVSSARDHFVHNGYFEGRLPFEIKVDEPWYLGQNPNVADYIRDGRLTTAQQHFDHDGYREGRLPFAL